MKEIIDNNPNTRRYTIKNILAACTTKHAVKTTLNTYKQFLEEDKETIKHLLPDWYSYGFNSKEEFETYINSDNILVNKSFDSKKTTIIIKNNPDEFIKQNNKGE